MRGARNRKPRDLCTHTATREPFNASSYQSVIDGARIAAACRAAGLTQRDLAALGRGPAPIARIESGRVGPAAATVERLLRAARPDGRAVLARHHDDIVVAVLAARGTGRVRVFGSVARGDDGPGADIDLRVDFGADADLFDVIDCGGGDDCRVRFRTVSRHPAGSPRRRAAVLVHGTGRPARRA